MNFIITHHKYRPDQTNMQSIAKLIQSMIQNRTEYV